MSEPQYTQIADLKPAMRNLNLRFIVLDVNKAMRTKEGQEVCTARIADRSGAINLTIWNELCSLLEPSDICRLHNGYTNVWKGALTVQTGKQGELKRIGQYNFAFSDVPDLSAVIYADWDQPQAGATSGGGGVQNKMPTSHATSNGTFASSARYERHESAPLGPPTGPASANHQHGAARPEYSHRQQSASSEASAPSAFPLSSTNQQPAALPSGARPTTGNSSATPNPTASPSPSPAPNAAGGNSSSLSAFRQAFIQQSAGTSSGGAMASRGNASSTPSSAAPSRGGTQMPAQQQVATTGNHKTSSTSESGRKHVYREIDMFASAPPEKKVRVTDAHAHASQNAPVASQHKALAKLKGEAGASVKAGLAQAATKK